MKSFKRFWEKISDALIATPRRLQALSELDPDRIYVENVRALIGSNTVIARMLCETAVRQGFFLKRVQVLCPDGAVAVSASSEAEIPQTVRCWRENDGELEETLEETVRLSRIEYYLLNREAAI